MTRSTIAIVIEESAWRSEGTVLVRDLRRAVGLAFAGTPCAKTGCLTILLADDARLEALNRRFRGKAKPTNVLSFPAQDGSYLGDIAIAHGVTTQEARQAGKTIHDHALHLAVHGALHLLGYDHGSADDARIMESLEKATLAKLGIADPYAAPFETVTAL